MTPAPRTRVAGRRPAAFVAPVLLVLALAPVGAVGQSATAAGDPPGRVTGRVTRAGGGALPYAWVRARTDRGVRQDLADSLGIYHLDVAPGRVVLEVDYLGHEATSVEVLVPPGTAVRVDVVLAEQALDLPGFVVVADPFSVPAPLPREIRPVHGLDPSVELAALTLDAGLARVAGAAGQARERGDPGSDGAQVLLMRGSTADLKLLLLDGAPVYTPFHLGGVLESFDTDVLGRAAHYVGAAPSRYDGGIDYILDLDTRRPTSDGMRLRGALDLLSARASGEWGEERGGLLASGRALHGGGAHLLDGVGSPYGYADGLVRGAWAPGGVEFGITAFANRESVALGLPDAPLVPEEAHWSNRALSFRASHVVGPVALEWAAAASRYDAALPLRTDTSVTTTSNPVLAEGRTGRLRATVDGRWVLREGQLRFGLSADRTEATYGSSLRTRTGYSRTDTRAEGTTVGLHGEISRRLSPSVDGRLGGRLDHFDPGGARAALRGSVAWSVTPSAVLSVAAGRYHQFTRAPDTQVEAALVTALDSVGVPGGPLTLLSVATGDHFVVGLDQTLTETVRLGLQGYVKRFDGVLGPGLRRSASGVDLRLQAGRGGRSGWLGYSLAWTWEDPRPEVDSSRFLGRHVMSAGYRGPVAGPVGLEARLSFSDGLPLTEVPLGTSSADEGVTVDPTPPLEQGTGAAPALAGDADDFLRIDFELFGEWDSPVGRGRVRPYLRLLNALDRRDALFYYFEPWRSPELRPLVQRSMLPVLGVAWSF